MAQPTFTIIYLICLYNQLPQQQFQILRLVCFMGKTKTRICVKVLFSPSPPKLCFQKQTPCMHVALWCKDCWWCPCGPVCMYVDCGDNFFAQIFILFSSPPHFDSNQLCCPCRQSCQFEKIFNQSVTWLFTNWQDPYQEKWGSQCV